jgi:hypothetical protein
MRSAVMFRGLKQVMKAYMANEIAAWSIWCGKSMPFRYEGDDLTEGGQQLKQAINMLKEGGSEAGYQLRVYDHLPSGKILSNTPDNGSFSFGLFDYDGEKSPYQQRTNSVLGAVNDKLEAFQAAWMEKILDKVKQDEEEEAQPAKPGGMMGFVGAMLDNPQIQGMLMQKIFGWLNPGERMPGAIGGIDQGQPAEPVSVSQEQLDKLNEAIDILIAHDPNIGDHLQKIARIARDEPGKYKMFAAML